MENDQTKNVMKNFISSFQDLQNLYSQLQEELKIKFEKLPRIAAEIEKEEIRQKEIQKKTEDVYEKFKLAEKNYIFARVEAYNAEEKVTKANKEKEKANEEVRKANEEARKANEEKEKANENLNTIKEITQKKYVDAIKILFKDPQEEIEENIKKTSSENFKKTLTISLVSILITLLVAVLSIIANFYSNKDGIKEVKIKSLYNKIKVLNNHIEHKNSQIDSIGKYFNNVIYSSDLNNLIFNKYEILNNFKSSTPYNSNDISKINDKDLNTCFATVSYVDIHNGSYWFSIETNDNIQDTLVFVIYNGYQKQCEVIRYLENSRVRTLNITCCSTTRLDIKYSINGILIEDKIGPQILKIVLNNNYNFNKFIFTIIDIYLGYGRTVAISEFGILRKTN